MQVVGSGLACSIHRDSKSTSQQLGGLYPAAGRPVCRVARSPPVSSAAPVMFSPASVCTVTYWEAWAGRRLDHMYTGLNRRRPVEGSTASTCSPSASCDIRLGPLRVATVAEPADRSGG